MDGVVFNNKLPSILINEVTISHRLSQRSLTPLQKLLFLVQEMEHDLP